MAKFYHLLVKEIVNETHNSVSISFEIPETLKNTFTFIAGQYITIQKELNGEQIRRDYSICSSQNSSEIRVGIKAVENGVFSQYATKELKAGDELEVSEPRGRFLLNASANNQKNYLAFVAGSGITPVLSMIKSALTIEDKSNFVLVYGNKILEDVMFKNDLDTLISKYPDRLAVHHIFSKTTYDGYLFGRINRNVVDNIVKVKYSTTNFDDYFICGPEPMINEVKKTLLEDEVSQDHIHFELFTVANAEENTEIIAEDLEGETEITVLLDDDEETFKMPKDKTILERVLLEGLDAPYSCQGGICSSCIAKVTKGKAIMEKNSILDDDEVAEGLILTCQAHPVTNKIVIDYDDV